MSKRAEIERTERAIYLWSLALVGLIGSLVVAVLAISSFDPVRRRRGSRAWKRLHRWIWVALGSIALVVVVSRPLTAIPHALALLVLIRYRLALWRDRRRRGHRQRPADILNWAAITAPWLAVVWFSGPWQMDEPVGIGLGNEVMKS